MCMRERKCFCTFFYVQRGAHEQRYDGEPELLAKRNGESKRDVYRRKCNRSLGTLVLEVVGTFMYKDIMVRLCSSR